MPRQRRAVRHRCAIACAFALLSAADRAAAAPPTTAPQAGASVVTHVVAAAQRFGIPESWIWAVLRVESRGQDHATSPAGAMGLMQIMPATWTAMRLRYRLGGDPYDPHDNIMAGAAFLREMHDRYGEPGFLAAYNAGPARYEDYLFRGRPLPAETTAYVGQLAPMIAGAPMLAVRADPLAWTRSALFVLTDDGPVSSTAAAAPQSSGPRSNVEPSPDRPSAHQVSGEDAAAPRPSILPVNGLFVHRSAEARPQ